nr:ATP synthase subunit 8 [Psylliodes affinis]
MPQMMPLNWLCLMLFFTLIFYCFNNYNYFLFFYNKKKNNPNLKMTKLNWKW